MTAYEGLYYCNNTGKISQGLKIVGGVREMLDHMQLHHKIKK